ncbi:MAG TPA: glycosyltransferase family 1 protein [Anaerolineae bacterium]|nr:glycosyltransferase family 1 protein [Anaerolineae bacterium]
MKIGIDYTSAVSQGAGIGRYTRELIRAVLALPSDHYFSLFYASRTNIQESEIRNQRSEIHHLRFHDKWLTRIWHRARLPIPIEVVIGKIDLFHSPDFTLPPTMPGVPTLLTVHDLSFMRDPDSAWPSLRAYLMQAVPRSVKRATHLLADSQATKDDLIDLFKTPPEKITVLYSGVDARFTPIRDRAEIDRVREKYKIGPSPFALSVGTLQPRKNYRRLIEAYAKLNNHRLHLVIGGGRGWMFDDLFTLVQSLQLEDRVHFIGFVKDEDLSTLYSAADLFVYVSLYEGFGLPLLEAMACGTPVIGSNTSSLPEVIGDVGLQVDPKDVDAIAQAMLQMLTRSDWRDRSVAAGIDRAKLFTWDKAAQQLLSIYEQLSYRKRE